MSAVQEILAVAPVVLIGLLATAVMVVDALIRQSARLSFWLSVVGLLGVLRQRRCGRFRLREQFSLECSAAAGWQPCSISSLLPQAF
jgi:hypothetical protein